MKTCKVCNKVEPEVVFESRRRQCKSCRSIYKHGIKTAWYARNKDYAKAKTKEWREANSERKRAYRRAEYVKNIDAAKLAVKNYREKHPYKSNHWVRMRQCAKMQRTPKWLNAEDKWMIAEFYDLAKLRSKCTGVEWNVDHIVPLRGKTVSGLHIPSNLQVILEQENKVKRNYFAEVNV